MQPNTSKKCADMCLLSLSGYWCLLSYVYEGQAVYVRTSLSHIPSHIFVLFNAITCLCFCYMYWKFTISSTKSDIKVETFMVNLCRIEIE
jgi:hypothetical protein